MRLVFKSALHLLILCVVFASVLVDAGTAYAQSRNCSQLGSTLNSLNRNREFRSLEKNTLEARTLASELQDFESIFIRGGCQKVLAAGKRLSRECRSVARRITQGRAKYNKLAASVETGQAVAQQRELALQQIARFGCGTGSNARVTITTRNNSGGLQNLFDRLFGNEGDIRYDDFYGFGNLSTLRTVCVRTCDGYYWPVSFSTVEEFLGEDEGRCQSQCPGAEVRLYYYRNPGEDPEDMINRGGGRYKSLPTAFAYRKEFDRNCSCKQQISYGSIEFTQSVSGGQSRAMIDFEGNRFPMPMRDPRRALETTITEVIVVPLPRRRPLQEGEEAPVVPAGAVIMANTEVRSFQFGDRTVRIVGPDTPYAQSAAKGF